MSEVLRGLVYEEVLTSLSYSIYVDNEKKGFWNLDAEGVGFSVDQKLLLIAGEVIEAHEEYRSNDDLSHVYYREDGKPEGFEFELADVLIRTLDLAGALGIDIGARVEEKLKFNRSRPHKHGRNF